MKVELTGPDRRRIIDALAFSIESRKEVYDRGMLSGFPNNVKTDYASEMHELRQLRKRLLDL